MVDNLFNDQAGILMWTLTRADCDTFLDLLIESTKQPDLNFVRL